MEQKKRNNGLGWAIMLECGEDWKMYNGGELFKSCKEAEDFLRQDPAAQKINTEVMLVKVQKRFSIKTETVVKVEFI